MNRNSIFILSLIIMLLFAASCSGNNGSLISPDLGEKGHVTLQATGGTICTGLWQFAADKATGDAELTQLRSADKIINVIGFLEPPPLSLMDLDWGSLNINFENGTIDVTVILTHPIPGDPVFTGFDVRGVCFGPKVTNADGLTIIPSPEYFNGVPSGYKDGLLGTPDSYANYEGLAGYKYFCDELAEDDDLATFFSDPANLAERGKFSSGAKNRRYYHLEWDGTGYDFLIFNYAIYANYNWPVGDPPFVLDDFEITSANSAEAFCCQVTETANSLYYDESLGGGGSISLDVTVWDWQGILTPTVMIESIEPGIIGQTPFTTYNGPATFPHAYLFDFMDVPGTPTSAGDLDLLITVVDEMTFGECWFMEPLDPGHVLYDENIYNCFGYTTDVEEGIPYTPADDVTGDLKLAITRGSSLGITGIKLDWTENTNPSPFYAIYADDNPYDGFDVDTFVAEVTGNTTIIDDLLWPALSTNGAYVFGVKGRNVSGMSATDSPNLSQLAFVEIQDWDGGSEPANWVLGYRNASYKWEIQATGQIDGSTSIRHNTYCIASQWSAYASPVIPAVPDSAMAFLEFAHIASDFGGESAWKAYMGGHTKNGAAPPTGTSSYGDLDNQDETSVIDGTYDYDNTYPGTGLAALIPFQASGDGWERGWRFTAAPNGTAQLTRISKPHFISKAGDTRAAVGWGRPTLWIENTNWCEIDEIAAVVY